MSDSNSEQVSNQYDQRQVNTETNSLDGSIQARDGSSITITDGGAISGSLDLAQSISKMLGQSINNVTTQAQHNVDSLVDLVGSVGSGVQGQSKATNWILMLAVAGALLVAFQAVRK